MKKLNSDIQYIKKLYSKEQKQMERERAEAKEEGESYILILFYIFNMEKQ